MICPDDKGGGIVVLDKTYYETEMHRILNDHDTYKELPNNPTLSYKRELQDLITKGLRPQYLKQKGKNIFSPIGTQNTHNVLFA